jgi:N-acyl-D-aspartate/D-glutamate deacylase
VVADVLVDNGQIAGVRPSFGSVVDDAAMVDGHGLCLAPGFIDLHSHSDLYSATEGMLGDGPKLLQGCTAQVFGQDGISAAPVRDDDLEDHTAFLAGLDGSIAPEAWSWRSFGEYLSALRTHSATRSTGLVGHATVRRYVMGTDARPPTDQELRAMQDALVTAFHAGACGFSSGLVYVPAAYADTAEVAALCEVVAARGLPFFVHVRSESERVEEATDEVIDVAARTGVHLHYSHIKTAGRSNWHKAASLLSKIDAARLSGVAVTADVHPYMAGSSTAIVLLPPWVQEGGMEVALRRLSDPSVRDRLRQQLLTDTTSWDNWYAFSDGWRGLKISGAHRRPIIGRYFSDVIAGAGISDPLSPAAFDVVFDLLVEERLGMSLVSFNNVEDNIASFLAQPYCSVGTDAVVNPDGHPHPRLHGTFPRVLGHFVRELGTVSLPEAVRKMTSQAAKIVGWEGKVGEIRPGLPADLVLFDPMAVADRASYEQPRETPAGIHGVWVGGRRMVNNGRLVDRTVAGAL